MDTICTVVRVFDTIFKDPGMMIKICMTGNYPYIHPYVPLLSTQTEDPPWVEGERQRLTLVKEQLEKSWDS